MVIYWTIQIQHQSLFWLYRKWKFHIGPSMKFVSAIGTVCFDTRLSCLGAQSNSDGGSYGIADQMVKATTNLFQAVQKTTFAFPWYALFRTQNYKQYVEAKTVSNRYS